jgi:hypothetical protein
VEVGSGEYAPLWHGAAAWCQLVYNNSMELRPPDVLHRLRQPLLLGETDGADSLCTRHGPIERPTSASPASTRLGRRQRRRCDRRRPLSAGSAAGGAALWPQRRGRRCGTARPAAHNQFQNPTFGVA